MILESAYVKISSLNLKKWGEYRHTHPVTTIRHPATLDFTNPLTPHLLVAGVTGSGKTNTQLLLAWSLAQHNQPDEVRLLVIDVEKRGRHWRALATVAHLLHPVVIDYEDGPRAVNWIVAELERRRTSQQTTPRIFLFIDELQSLLEMTHCVDALARLARVGRDFGLHLVVATQYPNVKALGWADFKRNLSARLVSRVDDATAARVATGQRNSGAELLAGPGDTIFAQPGALNRLTVPCLTETDYKALPRAANTARLPLAEVEPANPYTTPDPMDPEQVAYALASGRGITHLAQQMGIGSGKAGRVKQFTDELRHYLRLHYRTLLRNMSKSIMTRRKWDTDDPD